MLAAIALQLRGVGHVSAARLNAVPPCAYGFFRKPVSLATGVGHKPEAVPLMRGANIRSSQHCPPAVIPERGQVTEDSSESPSNESWAVFHVDEAGSNLAHDARHVGPHAAAGAVNACAFAGNADVLAREASRNHVNNASPRPAVKTAHVRPNRERSEGSIVLSLRQNLCGVGITFNCADGSPPEQVAAKNSSTRASEQSQLIHATVPARATHCAQTFTPLIFLLPPVVSLVPPQPPHSHLW